MHERTFGIGLDLGTSNSAVCRVDTSTGSYEWQQALDRAGSREIVSAIYIDTNGDRYYGKPAAERQRNKDDAHRVIPNLKLLLRENRPMTLSGVGSYDPTDLMRGFIAYLKGCYESHFHEPCNRAVISVPAHEDFDFDYRERIRETVYGSGDREPLFESVATLHEPDAVLLSMIDLSPLFGKTVLVFDMGGGTLDVSIRHVDEEGGKPKLAHCSVVGSSAAGVKVTEALVNDILDRWQGKGGFTFSKEERLSAARVNHFGIDYAKRQLAGLATQDGLDSLSTYNCQVNFPSRGLGWFSDDIPASRLTELSRPTCDLAVATVEKALSEAGMVANEIDVYFMVGGSSRLPLMVQLLQAFFQGRYPNPPMGAFGSVEPLSAVSRGAALEDLDREDEPARVPNSAPVLERRLPYSISIVVDERSRTECLVEKNAELPFGPVTKTFYLPVRDDNVDIELVRGQGRIDECVPVARRTVYFAKTLERNTEFKVSLYVDDDGEVTVTALSDLGEPVTVITAPRLEQEAA